MFIVGLFTGLYLGIGLGYTFWVLADVGLGAGKRLLWRVPALVLFWPVLFVVAIAGQRR